MKVMGNKLVMTHELLDDITPKELSDMIAWQLKTLIEEKQIEDGTLRNLEFNLNFYKIDNFLFIRESESAMDIRIKNIKVEIDDERI